MIESVANDHEALDWVGCLVLAVASDPLVRLVGEAAAHTERTILADPVLADLARVSTSHGPLSLHSSLDEITLRLYQELAEWGASPARNPAPRFTFCLLVVHDDLDVAERLVRELADTELLSDLPIVFRLGHVTTPDSATGHSSETVGRVDEVVQFMMDAATAAAFEVETSPQFCLTRSDLAAVTAERSSSAGRPAASRLLPAPARPAAPSLDDEVATSAPNPAGNRIPEQDDDGVGPGPKREVVPTGTADGPSEIGSASNSGPQPTLPRPQGASAPTGSGFGSLLPRRRRQRSNVETIDHLGALTAAAAVLYVVLVSEPVRPSRADRRLREEVSLQLARTVFDVGQAGETPWVIRVFEAGDTLRGGTLLADTRTVGRRDFRQRWGGYPDLHECVDALGEHLHRDTLSFARRGIHWSRSVTVFLAGDVPDLTADSISRLSALGDRTETIWVSFGRAVRPADEEQAPGALRLLQHHEDVVSELSQLIFGSPSSVQPVPSAVAWAEPSAPADPETPHLRPSAGQAEEITQDGAG